MIVISAFKNAHNMHLSENDAKRAVLAAGTMLGISGLGGLIYLPILMKSLNGMRRVYIVLQQICIVGFLLTQLLSHVFMNEAEYLYAMRVHKMGAENDIPFSLADLFWRPLLASLFQSFFRFAQYFLSFMQSFDIYKMIHDPLSYAEFCSKINILMYLGAGLGICLALVMEYFIEIIVVCMIITDPEEFMFKGPQWVQFSSITNILRRYSLVKFIATKVIYSGVIIGMAARTKTALRQSTEINADKKKSRLYKRLFIFTLIPLGMNFWNLFPECLDELWPISRSIDNTYDRSFFLRKDTRTYIDAITATVATFTYFVAFPLLFPKVKESIMCGIWKKE